MRCGPVLCASGRGTGGSRRKGGTPSRPGLIASFATEGLPASPARTFIATKGVNEIGYGCYRLALQTSA